jgi:virginiamycin B lyase
MEGNVMAENLARMTRHFLVGQAISTRPTDFLLVAAACLGSVLLQGVPSHARAATTAPSVLEGQVSSVGEGALEGVVVTARKEGASFTVSVVSNKAGLYRFPPGRLEPGHYALNIRAIGYVIDRPGSADVVPGKPATANLRLSKTKNVAEQMSDTEWLMSLPDNRGQTAFLRACIDCHSIQRVVRSTYNKEQFPPLISRMTSYAYNSFDLHPQLRKVPRTYKVFEGGGMFPYYPETTPEWLASINLSSAPNWRYPLKTLPRLTGESTKVIITEYDLPRKDIEPHDVVVDRDGIVWFGEFDRQFLGRFDPKTGQVKEFPIPVNRPGFPEGGLDLEFDEEGNLWLSMMHQTGAVKFDKVAKRFETIKIPEDRLNDETQQGHIAPQHWEVDGKVWMQDAGLRGIHRVDLKTGKWETFQPFKTNKLPGRPAIYGIYADTQNNLWFMEFGVEHIGRIDAKTGEISYWPTPTPNSNPRRGRFDDEGHLWFAEYGVDQIGMFNVNTLQFKEWPLGQPWSGAYDVAPFSDEQVWVGSMSSDRVARLNPKTGEVIEYQLPRSSNVRGIFVDKSQSKPVVWIGNNHGASIIKLELLN